MHAARRTFGDIAVEIGADREDANNAFGPSRPGRLPTVV
jgi:hypothetical protein